MGGKQQRFYLTVIDISGGIITLVEPDGRLGQYRQRGMERIGRDERIELLRSGALSPMWREFEELPKNYKIAYEDEEIMGKARATFKR